MIGRERWKERRNKARGREEGGAASAGRGSPAGAGEVERDLAVGGGKNGIEVHHCELLEPYAPAGFLSPCGGPSLRDLLPSISCVASLPVPPRPCLNPKISIC
ncbi:hypothetical protein VPH35_053146 [Triticum aestivum]